LDIPPAFVVAPATLETSVEQILTAITYPVETTDANVFFNRLQPVIVPALDGSSVAKWYLFANPDLYPVLEYSYLAGEEGVQVDSRPGWDVLGQEFRAVLTYGVGVVDHRGACRNEGS
jgi:hypothetical protein